MTATAGSEHTDHEPLSAIASLGEPTRRRLYAHVVDAGDAVSRDDAAAAVGVSRSLAAFHLDRLASVGLLEIEYRRMTGRSGPGAGRPAKLYRRSPQLLAVSLPPRHYALAAEVLAEAIDRDPAALQVGIAHSARERGRGLAETVVSQLSRRASRARRVEALREVLATAGFEPYDAGAEIRLRNCPFHPLATRHVALVCGMNEGLVAGAAEALGLDVPLRLDPRPGECCVVVST